MKEMMLGVENFKEMIDGNYYYIDKTHMIESVLRDKVGLYTRPRRFGKTLNLSMLKYFFSIREKDNSYLFDGLEITNNQKAMKYQNQYPVISLSLKDLRCESFDEQLRAYALLLSDITYTYYDIVDGLVNPMDQEMFLRISKSECDKQELSRALMILSRIFSHYYHKKVIILIDEYDVPLQHAYIKGYYDEMVEFLRNVFSSTLKTNDYLEKGILSGCLRIAKESIFTGLNNFKVHSITDPMTSSDFGFTINEVKAMLDYYHLENHQQIIQDWYDGYNFGGQDIYNPWSTMNYMNDARFMPHMKAISYWANSSGNDIVYDYISHADTLMKQDLELLIEGKTIKKHIKEELTYRELDQMSNIYSFLLFTGYLKFVSYHDNVYELKIPNKEVREIYTTFFREWFPKGHKHDMSQFISALYVKDDIKATDILSQVLIADLSYYDHSESFYHGFLLGILESAELRVKSNRESGLGRFDLCVYPKSKGERCLLIEVKYTREKENLDKLVEEALAQIKKQKYLVELYEDGYQDVVGYGIAFSGKNCLVKLFK